MEKTKRKKKGGGGGRKAPQYHSRQLALKATRQTVGMCMAGHLLKNSMAVFDTFDKPFDKPFDTFDESFDTFDKSFDTFDELFDALFDMFNKLFGKVALRHNMYCLCAMPHTL